MALLATAMLLPGRGHPLIFGMRGGVLESVPMNRPHFHPSRCKVCGGGFDEVGSISQTGLCRSCGNDRLIENTVAMKTKRGPFAQWWAYKMAVSVGYAPLDEAPERP